MHWKELQKQIGKFPPAPHYFQALEQVSWDKAEEIPHNIQICCDFLDMSPGSQIDKQKLEEVWRKTVEPLADCVEGVFLERHGMLKAEDKKEFGVGCVGQAIQRMYDELTSLIGLTNASGPVNKDFIEPSIMRLIRFLITEMPFSKDARFVSRFRKHLCNRHGIEAQAFPLKFCVSHAGAEFMSAGHQTRAGGRAGWTDVEGCKTSTALVQCVEIRRFYELVPMAGQLPVALVVGHNQHDVRPFPLYLRRSAAPGTTRQH